MGKLILINNHFFKRVAVANDLRRVIASSHREVIHRAEERDTRRHRCHDIQPADTRRDVVERGVGVGLGVHGGVCHCSSLCKTGGERERAAAEGASAGSVSHGILFVQYIFSIGTLKLRIDELSVSCVENAWGDFASFHGYCRS